MELSTHLQFNGQCAAAFRFYEQCLGGRIVALLTHGETPAKDDVAEAERIFKALAEDGTVTMPFQQTFWSPGFGMAVDRFGIPWMINTEQAA